jgi:hypothetical protein
MTVELWETRTGLRCVVESRAGDWLLCIVEDERIVMSDCYPNPQLALSVADAWRLRIDQSVDPLDGCST